MPAKNSWHIFILESAAGPIPGARPRPGPRIQPAWQAAQSLAADSRRIADRVIPPSSWSRGRCGLPAARQTQRAYAGRESRMLALGAAVGQAGQIIAHGSLADRPSATRRWASAGSSSGWATSRANISSSIACAVEPMGQHVRMSINVRVQKLLQLFLLLGQLPAGDNDRQSRAGRLRDCRSPDRPAARLAEASNRLPASRSARAAEPAAIRRARAPRSGGERAGGRRPRAEFPTSRRASSRPSSSASSASCVS